MKSYRGFDLHMASNVEHCFFFNIFSIFILKCIEILCPLVVLEFQIYSGF